MKSILVLHAGMGDASSWKRVTDHLDDRFRVVRLHRRQYRLDVPRTVTMADETAEVNAVDLERPILVGHSSGAVLALECLVAAPGRYAAAILYEPPVVLDEPLGGGGRIDRARAALAVGKPGTAFAIFVREVAGIRSPMIAPAKFMMNRNRTIGPVVERQLDDNDAIDALGNRLEAYRKIDVPVLLIAGERSPRHLIERLDALRAVLPHAETITLQGTGHNAEREDPAQLAAAVAAFAASVEP